MLYVHFPAVLSILVEDMMDTAANDITETIYAENKEMTPAIDLENEEIGEDENEDIGDDENEMSEDENEVSEDYILELEGESDKMMMEFDESDEDGDDNDYRESDKEVIIDKSFSNKQMPRTFSKFAPYFKNITKSLFFCWMEKHRICKLNPFETYYKLIT